MTTEMIFETHSIGQPLDKCIESIFYYKDFMPQHSIERVVPTGHIFLLFELDGIERKTFDEDLHPLEFFRNTWVSGMQQKYLNISSHQHSEMLVVQFKTTGAFPFLHIPVERLNGTVAPSQLYFGDSILSLRNSIIAQQNVAGKFRIVEQWLLEKFDEQSMPPPEIIDVVTRLQIQPYSKHSELLKDFPKTNKHLIDQFKKYCGLTPKVLHRIFRFNTLLALIHQKEQIIWSDIAYETGYADQSHFIKEFQEFCGFNPGKYIQNRYNESMPNFFPIDRQG